MTTTGTVRNRIAAIALAVTATITGVTTTATANAMPLLDSGVQFSTTTVDADNVRSAVAADYTNDRRQAAAQRASRHAIRGGAPRYLDSGDMVWAGQPKWIREVGLCIRKHESLMAGHYKAHNGSSSAAGAYQFLDGTWQGNARYAKFQGKYVARKYAAANHAPAWVQDVVFIHAVKGGGLRAWYGTNCPGTG